jgi:sensor domain CHASE-containing protein
VTWLRISETASSLVTWLSISGDSQQSCNMDKDIKLQPLVYQDTASSLETWLGYQKTANSLVTWLRIQVLKVAITY